MRVGSAGWISPGANGVLPTGQRLAIHFPQPRPRPPHIPQEEVWTSMGPWSGGKAHPHHPESGQAFLEMEVLRLVNSPKGSDEDGSVGPPHFLSLHQLPPESKGSSLNYQKFSSCKNLRVIRYAFPHSVGTPKHHPHAW